MTSLIERLREIDKLEKKATPGPWTVQDMPMSDAYGILNGDYRDVYTRIAYTPSRSDHKKNDADFISALRNAWPEIRAALESPGESAERASVPEGWVVVPVPKGMRTPLEVIGKRLREQLRNRFFCAQPTQFTDNERQVLLTALHTLDAALSAAPPKDAQEGKG